MHSSINLSFNYSALHFSKSKLIFLLLLSCLFYSCKSNNKYPYAIRDFSNSLQPHLTGIVSTGIVGFDKDTRFVQEHATDEELKKLSKSEHPILRAVAFRAMLERSSFNHFDIIMNNLDDTAVVATDAGEWGVHFSKVSDDMVRDGTWKDTVAKNKTIEELILKHNYLKSAYDHLTNIELKPIYYPYIKAMAIREIDYDYTIGLGDANYSNIENALYALAKYKRAEDIPFIKDILLANISQMSYTSFWLMADYPNELYLDIFEKYYPKVFYRKICRDQETDIAMSFIRALATYKNERSAKILNSILHKDPLTPCNANTYQLKETLVYAIWENRCEAYSTLGKQVESLWKKYEGDRKESEKYYQSQSAIPSENIYSDRLEEPVRW